MRGACQRAPQPGTQQVICGTHGNPWIDNFISGRGGCSTLTVLHLVAAERQRQYDQYGTNETLADGTGPQVRWAAPASGLVATDLEQDFRTSYEAADNLGRLTWRHLVLEEIAEAFQETDPQRLTEELIQVAALAVSWVEKITARPTPEQKADTAMAPTDRTFRPSTARAVESTTNFGKTHGRHSATERIPFTGDERRARELVNAGQPTLKVRGERHLPGALEAINEVEREAHQAHQQNMMFMPPPAPQRPASSTRTLRSA